MKVRWSSSLALLQGVALVVGCRGASSGAPGEAGRSGGTAAASGQGGSVGAAGGGGAATPSPEGLGGSGAAGADAAAGADGGEVGVQGGAGANGDGAALDGHAASVDAIGATDVIPLPAPQPRGYPAGSSARTEAKTITGALSHTTIGFQVYLPPGYDSGTARYPTIYDLHGIAGNQFDDPQWVVPSLEAAMKKNLIGPVIVVFPDGLVDSYYADSKDGTKPSETRIVKELIPHIDATYRTIAHRHLRALTGFSMGGYGALELAVKFPDIFGAAVAYDGALDTWQTLTARRAAIAAATFGNDQAYFDEYSPWANARTNAAALRAASALRLVPGTTYQMFDAAFRDAMGALPVPLDYVETTCPHDYGCLLGAQGAQSWTFIEAAFEQR